MTDKLPPMPPLPDPIDKSLGIYSLYDEAQLIEYALAAMEMEREACIEIALDMDCLSPAIANCIRARGKL